MHELFRFEGLADLKVLRDGCFVATGKLSTPIDGLCVPLRSINYVEEVNANPRIAAVITTPAIADAVDKRLALAVAPDPEEAHSEVHALCAEARESELRSRPTIIDGSAQIDPAAKIAEYGVTIGPRVRVGPNVVIAPGVSIESDCIFHPGVMLGVSGFNTGIIGGRRRIVPQLGGVRIESFVELLANCCVARAIYGGSTTIGEETVTDNLVYIAHDVTIGRRVQICALANILGRAVIGDEAYVGPSAVIVNGARIGARARISLGAVVTQNVEDDATVTGNFAVPHERFLAHLRAIR